MELKYLIEHPEALDRETLYDLRSIIALYPYHQTARLLMLQNLYILHDPTFDEELRRSAIYITNRQVLFDLVESAHYKLQYSKTNETKHDKNGNQNGNRTTDLINDFLDSTPADTTPAQKKHRTTPTDATIDYLTWLTEMEAGNENTETTEENANDTNSRSAVLINTFLIDEGGKLTIPEKTDYTPHMDVQLEDDTEDVNPMFYTTNFAKILIKQGQYFKAKEIIQQLNLLYPKKNAYFADQMRFLEKLIVNEEAKNNIK